MQFLHRNIQPTRPGQWYAGTNNHRLVPIMLHRVLIMTFITHRLASHCVCSPGGLIARFLKPNLNITF